MDISLFLLQRPQEMDGVDCLLKFNGARVRNGQRAPNTGLEMKQKVKVKSFQSDVKQIQTDA